MIEFRGPQNSFAGAISGAGGVILGSGSKDAISRGTTITTAFFTITDGHTVVTLDRNLSYAGTFTLENSATLDLAGITLTLSGTDTLQNSAVLDGSGVLVTQHGSSTTVNGFVFGGSDIWENSGTVGEVNTLQLGDATFNAVTFINEKGGIYEFTNDNGISIGPAFGSSFVNDACALLEKTAGTGTSQIFVAVTDNGTIRVQSGTIEFTGFNNSFAGKIAGAGAFEIGGGQNVIAGGTTIKTAIFDIFNGGTLVTLGENLSYARIFNFEGGADLNLGGFTLTLSGSDTFNGVLVDGTGTLVTAAGSKISLTNLTLGGAVVWQNSGTITEFNNLQIGDSSFDVAKFVNERGGTIDFTADVGIAIGALPSYDCINSAGATVAKTGGSGDSQIFAVFTNNGKVIVDTGMIEFVARVSGTGSFTIEPGTVLQFDASVAKGSSVDFATRTGGQLTLFDSPGFAATIRGFGGANADKIDLRDINFNSGSFHMSFNAAKDILTVTDGSHTAKLQFFGKYAIGNFHASFDGANGTLIVDPTTHATLLASAR
jgi:hypothetical protein